MSELMALTSAGYNVLTDTNPLHFIFNSNYNTFKILYQSPKTSVSVNTGSNIYTITHNAIRTPPLFTIFAQFPDGKITSLNFINTDSYNNAQNGGDSHSINATWWDNTNIYIYIASVLTAYTVNLVWYEYEPELV